MLKIFTSDASSNAYSLLLNMFREARKACGFHISVSDEDLSFKNEQEGYINRGSDTNAYP